MYRLHTISVLARSKLCQFSANFQWGWTDTGPKYVEFVQVLSKKREFWKKPDWTNSGHRLDLRKVRSGFSFWVFQKDQIEVDRDWEIGQPLDLDRRLTLDFRFTASKHTIEKTCSGQTLYKLWTWTDLGQSKDFKKIYSINSVIVLSSPSACPALAHCSPGARPPLARWLSDARSAFVWRTVSQKALVMSASRPFFVLHHSEWCIPTGTPNSTFGCSMHSKIRKHSYCMRSPKD